MKTRLKTHVIIIIRVRKQQDFTDSRWSDYTVQLYAQGYKNDTQRTREIGTVDLHIDVYYIINCRTYMVGFHGR